MKQLLYFFELEIDFSLEELEKAYNNKVFLLRESNLPIKDKNFFIKECHNYYQYIKNNYNKDNTSSLFLDFYEN